MNPSAAAGLEGVHAGPGQDRQREHTACLAGSSNRHGDPRSARASAGIAAGNHVTSARPESGPITGPPYTIYLDAESAKYDVYVPA